MALARAGFWADILRATDCSCSCFVAVSPVTKVDEPEPLDVSLISGLLAGAALDDCDEGGM
jgi:hypothetical protein